MPITTAVCVVGAGPTGLTLSSLLAKAGVPFLLLDRLPAGANTSRAAVIHARTLEALETVHARYVVGADGMHSVVREKAVIQFSGGTYEESFVLADVSMQWPLSHTEVTLNFAPEGLERGRLKRKEIRRWHARFS